ncbi:hypothetical protein [Comamonas antarctica]|uniref:hypothetical protein n=1 Tax=Comamonas antarctica TaxID=2743470 RepID=UPI0028E81DDA|nr:hypothetical protein [Comamonas antarctica]
MSIEQNELRRLQELAAKAAGLTIRGYDFGTPSRHACVLIDTGAAQPVRWSSWFNDGDAFRLFVDLGLQASPPRSAKESAWCSGFASVGVFPPRMLMRMAITSAAADRALQMGLAA